MSDTSNNNVTNNPNLDESYIHYQEPSDYIDIPDSVYNDVWQYENGSLSTVELQAQEADFVEFKDVSKEGKNGERIELVEVSISSGVDDDGNPLVEKVTFKKEIREGSLFNIPVVLDKNNFPTKQMDESPLAIVLSQQVNEKGALFEDINDLHKQLNISQKHVLHGVLKPEPFNELRKALDEENILPYLNDFFLEVGNKESSPIESKRVSIPRMDVLLQDLRESYKSSSIGRDEAYSLIKEHGDQDKDYKVKVSPITLTNTEGRKTPAVQVTIPFLDEWNTELAFELDKDGGIILSDDFPQKNPQLAAILLAPRDQNNNIVQTSYDVDKLLGIEYSKEEEINCFSPSLINDISKNFHTEIMPTIMQMLESQELQEQAVEECSLEAPCFIASAKRLSDDYNAQIDLRNNRQGVWIEKMFYKDNNGKIVEGVLLTSNMQTENGTLEKFEVPLVKKNGVYSPIGEKTEGIADIVLIEDYLSHKKPLKTQKDVDKHAAMEGTPITVSDMINVNNILHSKELSRLCDLTQKNKEAAVVVISGLGKGTVGDSLQSSLENITKTKTKKISLEEGAENAQEREKMDAPISLAHGVCNQNNNNLSDDIIKARTREKRIVKKIDNNGNIYYEEIDIEEVETELGRGTGDTHSGLGGATARQSAPKVGGVTGPSQTSSQAPSSSSSESGAASEVNANDPQQKFENLKKNADDFGNSINDTVKNLSTMNLGGAAASAVKTVGNPIVLGLASFAMGAVAKLPYTLNNIRLYFKNFHAIMTGKDVTKETIVSVENEKTLHSTTSPNTGTIPPEQVDKSEKTFEDLVSRIKGDEMSKSNKKLFSSERVERPTLKDFKDMASGSSLSKTEDDISANTRSNKPGYIKSRKGKEEAPSALDALQAEVNKQADLDSKQSAEQSKSKTLGGKLKGLFNKLFSRNKAPVTPAPNNPTPRGM